MLLVLIANVEFIWQLREIRKERNSPGKKDKSSDDHSNRFWQYGIFKGDQSARSHDSFFMDDGDEDANM